MDILGINAWVALVFQQLRNKAANLQNGQDAVTYEGVDSNNKPLFRINGKVLTGNFSFNAGMRKGAIILGDTKDYLSAQSVTQEITLPEEEEDANFFKDHFLVSRPDGSCGFLRVRTPRENGIDQTENGNPIVELCTLSYPFSLRGNSYLEDINLGMFSSEWLKDWIRHHDSVSIEKTYEQKNTLETAKAGFVTPFPTNAPTNFHYCVDPIVAGIFIGAGFEGGNPTRTGYNVVQTESGPLSLAAIYQVKSYQYDFQKQAQEIINEKQDPFRSNLPVFRVISFNSAPWFVTEIQRELYGYHVGEILLKNPLNGDPDYQRLNIILAGVPFATNVSRSTEAWNNRTNGFSTEGFGVWDVIFNYDATCDGQQKSRRTWRLPRLHYNHDYRNIFLQNENYDCSQPSGSFPYDYQIYYDRSVVNGGVFWNDTGLSLTTDGSGGGGFGGGGSSCFSGIRSKQTSRITKTITDLLSGDPPITTVTESTSYVGGIENHPCIYESEIENPPGRIVKIKYEEFEGGLNYDGIFDIYNSPYQINPPYDGLTSCDQWELMDRVHEGGFAIHVEASTWVSETKPTYRDFFAFPEGEVRHLTPSFYGTAFLEIIHPVEYIAPNGFEPTYYSNFYQQDCKPFEEFVGDGYVPDQVSWGLIGDTVAETDLVMSLTADWSAIAKGYNLVVQLPPLYLINSFIGDKKFEIYSLAYEDGINYYWPKVAVKLYDSEYWLGHPLNKNARLRTVQQREAASQDPSIRYPEDPDTYPGLWADWSEPVPIADMKKDTWIYSVKETDQYFNPEIGNDEDRLNQYVEWTVAVVIPDESGDPSKAEYILNFFYGTLSAFISNPFPDTFSILKSPSDPILYNRQKSGPILIGSFSNKAYKKFVYYNDTDYTVPEIMQKIFEEGQGPVNPYELGNVGLQIQYDLFTNSVLFMGFEKSGKKDRPGGLVAGINKDNEFILVRGNAENSPLGNGGAGFLKYQFDVKDALGAGRATFIKTKENTLFEAEFLDVRYCLTSLPASLRGLADQCFEGLAGNLPGGGVNKYISSVYSLTPK